MSNTTRLADVCVFEAGGVGFPERLLALPRPPTLVRVRGQLPPGRSVAIVGTRRADPEALAFTADLVHGLVGAGVVVVSGGAVGVDAAAHEAALAARGATLVVLPTGFSPPYPTAHAALFGRVIAAGGGLISELPDGTAPRASTFLRRNELVAALVDAVVVVQAPHASGALSTAAVARRLRRPLLAVPHAPWDPRGEGNLTLLRAGALPCTSAADIVHALEVGAGASEEPSSRAPRALTRASAPQAPARRQRALARDEPLDLGTDERLVWHASSRIPRHPDELARATGLPAERVRAALLGLLLAGRVDERDGGRYVSAPPVR